MTGKEGERWRSGVGCGDAANTLTEGVQMSLREGSKRKSDGSESQPGDGKAHDKKGRKELGGPLGRL